MAMTLDELIFRMDAVATVRHYGMRELKRFRESCGVSLGRHLRRLRLEKACGLLRMSTNRVSEISEQCGFTSVFSFSRAFHHTYGVSPSDYRRGGGASHDAAVAKARVDFAGSSGT